MLTRSSLASCWLALLAFLLPAAVLAQSTPTTAGPASERPAQQAERAITQPGNNAPVWREVRSGAPNYTTVQGREAGVLVQSSGDTWRRIRNGPITVYGGWLVVVVALAIAAFYLVRGPIKTHDRPTGNLVYRFSVVERWAHWTMAISFCLLAVTGLIMLFGKHVLLPVIGYTLFAWLSALSKNLHNFVAPLFAVSVLALILVFVRDNIPKAGDLAWILGIPKFFLGKHLPSGRFNGGEKGWFWIGVVALSLTLVVSGAILLFPNFDQLRSTMQTASVVHWICALLLIAMSLGHIYVGTIGVEGAYQSMREGRVDETWAKEHHQLWYEEVKRGGKKAASGGAMPAGATQMREKT
jgi:formate dehydrogenase subunit gamma